MRRAGQPVERLADDVVAGAEPVEEAEDADPARPAAGRVGARERREAGLLRHADADGDAPAAEPLDEGQRAGEAAPVVVEAHDDVEQPGRVLAPGLDAREDLLVLDVALDRVEVGHGREARAAAEEPAAPLVGAPVDDRHPQARAVGQVHRPRRLERDALAHLAEADDDEVDRARVGRADRLAVERVVAQQHARRRLVDAPGRGLDRAGHGQDARGAEQAAQPQVADVGLHPETRRLVAPRGRERGRRGGRGRAGGRRGRRGRGRERRGGRDRRARRRGERQAPHRLRDLDVHAVLAGDGEDQLGPVRTRAAQERLVGRVAEDDQGAGLAGGEEVVVLLVLLDDDDRLAAAAEIERQLQPLAAQAADHRVAAEAPEPEPGQLVGEQDGEGPQDRVERDRRGRPARDVEHEAGLPGDDGELQDEQLDRLVEQVRGGVARAQVVAEADHAQREGRHDPHQHEPGLVVAEHTEQPPHGPGS